MVGADVYAAGIPQMREASAQLAAALTLELERVGELEATTKAPRQLLAACKIGDGGRGAPWPCS